jgi:DNA polymerase bacteriophage-type
MHDIVQIRSNVLYPAAAASWRDTKLHVLHRDYETRSRAILKTVGTYKYAADLSTEVLCCAYAVDDEPVQLWTPGDPVPAAFIEAATNPAWVVAAHNDAFETAIEQYILAPRYGWPVIPIERHRCTMAAALAAGLPARLGAVADALDLANRKDRAGERLMHQISKPRRARKGEDLNQVHWFDDDDRLRRLYEYCRQDIAVE